MRIPLAVLASFLSLGSTLAAPPTTPRSDYGEPNGVFPNWEERAMAQLTNRARVEPSTELAGCLPDRCREAACYSPAAPLFWSANLNRAARFHSTSLTAMGFWGHETPCILLPDISTRYPGTSNGSRASSCTDDPGFMYFWQRTTLFGTTANGENIAMGYSPIGVFYAWLHETTSQSSCGYYYGSPYDTNGHRYSILEKGAGLGVGYSPQGFYTQDFGDFINPFPKIPSGSHWTASGQRDPSPGDNAVEFWANWYDNAGPTTSTVVLDNVSYAMTRNRGTNANGAYKATVNNVSTGCHTYYFSFTDSSQSIVRYPTIGNLGFGPGCPDYSGGITAPSAPTGVSATATSGTQVQVTWNAVAGATSYEVVRRDPGSGVFALRGTSSSTSYNDTASAGSAYLYRVRALNTGGSSGDSLSDLATTATFTNDPLSAGLLARATHLAELRTAVNAVRAQAGLSAGSYTDAAAAGVTVKAIHITQLRSALDQAMTTLSMTTAGWTDGTLTGVAIKATHLQEIRNRVK